MFAVKGWSVDSAALKPQTEVFSTAKRAKDVAGATEGKHGKKRKRGVPAPKQEEDVGKLWEQHIEGKEAVKTKSAVRREKERKKRKLDDGEKANGSAEAGKDRDRARSDGLKTKKKAKALPVNSTPLGVRKVDSSEGGPEHTAQDATPGSAAATSAATQMPPAAPPLPTKTKLTPMQSAMRQKLVSARFRHLNQTLYTAPSSTALDLFASNPEMFEDYHAGFRQQVAVWPENPVDTFIATLRARGAVKPAKFHRTQHSKPTASVAAVMDGDALDALPRTHGTCIIADLGCGDARLAHTLTSSNETSSLNLKIHSYDLHSPSRLVTKADISSLPLADGSIDVAIFCLALMGTNWLSFVEEAYRVLHWKGELWVAEIKSRFGRVGGRAGGQRQKVVEHSVGSKRKSAAAQKARDEQMRAAEEVDEATALRTEVDGVEAKPAEETDVGAFVEVLRRRGFVLRRGEGSVELGNRMFVTMEFIKAAAPVKGKGAETQERQQGGGEQGAVKRKKFIDQKKEEGNEVASEDEAKVLKPCLYKVR